ncbi:MAG TPA: RNA-binding S4 domain-containing protein [Opitutus sp.]|nr:RNA-binding S4 domain-containing protein [Opitutus sp.]
MFITLVAPLRVGRTSHHRSGRAAAPTSAMFFTVEHRLDCPERGAMTQPSAPTPREVIVREVPIELCQFIKFGGLADSGGAAKQLIAEGSVLLNDTVETRKRKKLIAGDRVTVGGETIVVRLG